MNSSLKLSSPRVHTILWFAVPLAFIALMVLFFPFRYRFEFDPDEGINAMKSLLSIRGYRLYSEIWSDQPPFFTLLLSLWFRIFGLNVFAGRVLVLLFSASILWVSSQYLRRYFGTPHAILGSILLVLLPFYLKLSASIMIGLPAVALALVSFLGLARWHESRGFGWLLLSATALGLSIMTKLFTAILVPIFFSGILLSRLLDLPDRRKWLSALMPSFIWLAIFSVVTGAMLIIIINPRYIVQMILIQINAAGSDILKEYAEQKFLNFFLDIIDAWPVLILAVLGGVVAYRARAWTAMYLVAWVILATIMLSINVPFWYHHRLLITVPAATLAAIAGGEGLFAPRYLLRSRKAAGGTTTLSLASLALVITYMYIRLPLTLPQLDLNLPNLSGLKWVDHSEYEIVATMWNYAEHTNWVYSDRLLFAFRANLAVPPELAVISKKRTAAGALSDDYILRILTEYQPEQIFQDRRNLPVIHEYMAERDYRRVDGSRKFRLYLRGDIQEMIENSPDVSNQE